MKKIIMVVALMWMLTSSVCAAEQPKTKDEIFSEQYQNSGVENLYDTLPNVTKDILDQWGISPQSGKPPEISTGSVFAHLMELLKAGFKQSLSICAAVVGLIIITSLGNSVIRQGRTLSAVDLSATLCVAATLLLPLFETIITSISVLKSSASFMLSLIPVYCAVLISGGFAATGTTVSGLMFAATQGVAQLLSFGLAPLMGIYLAISVSAAFAPSISFGGIAESVKKTANWIISSALTIFLGVLGLQTGVSSSTDTLSVKAAKYLAGSIPVVGGAVSETVSVVRGSLSLLGTSVFGYGVVALAAILLPLIAELIIWRIGINICAGVCSAMSIPRIERMIRACDAVAAFLFGITIYIGLLFIISLSIVSTITGGKAV